MFTRSGSSWTQQGAPLNNLHANGFGFSVALSADGNTALIGALDSNTVLAYTRSGSTWTDEGPVEANGVSCGQSVALSAAGNTALVGCPGDFGGDGDVQVLQRSGGTWTKEATLYGIYGGGETLEGQFGHSVALSADGNTALVGGPLDNSRAGAVWVFTRAGTTWEPQSGKLSGSEEIGQGYMGESVSLSADGNTALVGGYRDDESVGAAWIFNRSGSTWTQQPGKLTGGEGIGKAGFGYGLALAADGQSALIGGAGYATNTGALWTFEHSGSSWIPSGAKFTGAAEGFDQFGFSVALSTDGYTALVGAPGHDSNVGAAWAYLTTTVPPPTIKKIVPAKGLAAGGTSVEITGTNFVDPTGVSFGPNAVTGYTVNSPTSITVLSPAGTSGPVQVRVITPWGESPITARTQFKYRGPTVTGVSPDSGSKGAEARVTVTGAGFALGAGTAISFGKLPGGSVSCSATTLCTVTAPTRTRGGAVDVVVKVGKAQSKRTLADRYVYE